MARPCTSPARREPYAILYLSRRNARCSCQWLRPSSVSGKKESRHLSSSPGASAEHPQRRATWSRSAGRSRWSARRHPYRCPFGPLRRCRRRPGRAARSGPGRVPTVRAVVEIHRALGGMIMRALLGGEFMPDPEATNTAFVVPSWRGADLRRLSRLRQRAGPTAGGRPAAGFRRRRAAWASAEMPVLALPAGPLRIDRAAVDEVGSSETAFRLAG